MNEPLGRDGLENPWIVRDHAVDAGREHAFEIGRRVDRPGEDRRPDRVGACDGAWRREPVLEHERGRTGATDHARQQSRHGYVIVQGSSSTVNLVRVLPRLAEAGINVKIIAAISEELFDRQPEAYRHAVLPPEARYDLMVVSTGTRRVWPLRDVGPLTDEYSLTSDWDNQWLTGGLEPDVITEAHLDAPSILAGIRRFGAERDQRMARQQTMLASLA